MHGQEGADRSGGRCAVRKALKYDTKGADRSGGRCMVRRAPTSLEGADR